MLTGSALAQNKPFVYNYKQLSLNFNFYNNEKSFAEVSFVGKMSGAFRGVYLTAQEQDTKSFRCIENKKGGVENFKFNKLENTLSFSTNRVLKNNNKIYADVQKEYNVVKNEIDIDTKVIVRKKFKVANTSRLLDLITIPVSALQKVKIEAASAENPNDIMLALIPEKYSPKLWNVRGRFSEIKIVFNKSTIVFKASAKSLLSINHYGGREVEVCVFPKINKYKLSFGAGKTFNLGYSIKYVTLD
jgi:hypothetical protein